MLIRFNVTNFLSFKEETEFNMLAGSPRSKKEHVYHQKGIDFVRAAALYGANGAGKSNLVKALAFLQGLIKGSESTQYDKHFKLDQTCESESSVFEIEFIREDILFAYYVSIFKNNIIEESLYEIKEGQDDRVLFERKLKDSATSLVVTKEYQKDDKNKLLIELYEEKLLKTDELFLSKVNEDAIDFNEIRIAFDWFFYDLYIIYPDSKVNTAKLTSNESEDIFNFTQKIISSLDTGIISLDFEETSLEDFFGEDDKETQDWLKEELFKEDHISIKDNKGNSYVVTKRKEGIVVCEMIAKHKTSNEGSVSFDINQESDGTQRLLDILPIIYTVIKLPKVFIIDEINRSVHPTLTKELLNLFMGTKETKGQLIFSTHEAQLLDLNIFRQDEIWFAEKNKSGATTLYPLSDFKVRPDLVLKKGYLSGRFGAIPFLGNLKELNWEEASNNG